MLIKSFIEWSLDSAKKDGLSIFSRDSTNDSSDVLAPSPTIGEVTAMIEELTAAEEKVPGDSTLVLKRSATRANSRRHHCLGFDWNTSRNVRSDRRSDFGRIGAIWTAHQEQVRRRDRALVGGTGEVPSSRPKDG
jgi:hypothetical protein